MNKKKIIRGHFNKCVDERMEMWKEYTVEYLVKQVFSRLSNDKTKGSFQKPQLGILDPGVGILTGEKRRPIFHGRILVGYPVETPLFYLFFLAWTGTCKKGWRLCWFVVVVVFFP